MFILLMMFIVTTTFKRYAQLRTERSEASPELKSELAWPLELAIDAACDYYLNGDALIESQSVILVTVLVRAAAGRLNTPLVISAGRRTPYRALVTVIDASTQVGLRRLSLLTARAEEPQ
ncbi:MAG: biopolymer transporter ExbD [Pseudomonadota bacterium]|nr:biopolymer transporter ExbD [Pseudomonadota bacterium]